MKQNQRALKNILTQPKFKLNLSMYFVMIGGLILNIIAFFTLHANGRVLDLMNNNLPMNFQTQMHINELTVQSVQVVLFGFVVFIIFSFFFALVVSHRIAGPQVAIKAYIEALKEGDYDYERNLRLKDELSEIMTALKELKPILEDRDRGRARPYPESKT
ncbi:MAG: hypothetical protein ABGY96_12715 [bacterium]|nr:hypothetical protein [Gammaproteobacteria bacterium]